jgi:hypothetical protein
LENAVEWGVAVQERAIHAHQPFTITAVCDVAVLQDLAQKMMVSSSVVIKQLNVCCSTGSILTLSVLQMLHVNANVYTHKDIQEISGLHKPLQICKLTLCILSSKVHLK